jgi:hypothetical protein
MDYKVDPLFMKHFLAPVTGKKIVIPVFRGRDSNEHVKPLYQDPRYKQ